MQVILSLSKDEVQQIVLAHVMNRHSLYLNAHNGRINMSVNEQGGIETIVSVAETEPYVETESDDEAVAEEE